MNTFTRVFTSKGFTETLVYDGKTVVKRYVVTRFGYEGLDKAWEFEEELPEHVADALEDRDEILIMRCLRS